MDMGLVVKPSISQADNTDLSASVGAGATTTLRTYNGKGTIRIVQKGNGNSNITLKYTVDGGADVIVATADTLADVQVGFNTSLVVKVVNGDGVGAHPSSDVSTTGVYQ